MWNRVFNRRTRALQSVFAGHYVDVKAFYALEFRALCNVSFLADLDNSAAFGFISDALSAEIVTVYQHIYFDHDKTDFYFNNTIFVLREKRMIELAGNYCQVLHGPMHNGWAKELLRTMSAFRIVPAVAPIGFAWQANEN